MDWMRSRLSLKLTLLILLLIFVFAGCISLILYRKSVTSLEREAYGRLEQTVRAYGNELDIEIANTMQITDTLAALIQEDYSAERLAREPDYLDRQIQRFDPYVKVIAQEFSLAKTAYIYYNWELDGRVHDIYYVDHDQDGLVTRQDQVPAEYYSDPESERGSKAWWYGPIQTRRGYWSSPYPWVFDDGSSTVFLSYTRAVFDNGRVIGVTGTDFKYENLTTLLNKIKVYRTGYPFLLDGDKQFLIHPTQEGVPLSELKQEPYKTLREDIPFKAKGAFRFTETDGSTWFIAYQRLHNDWILGLAAPVAEVTESARAMTLLIIGMLSFFVPLIALAAFMAARQVTVPIQALTETVRRIESGEYAPHMSSRILARMDELGRLGRAIQNMGFALEENINEVNEKNEQLQQEISEKKEVRNSFNLVYEAFAAAENGLIITDERLRVIHANPAFTRLAEFAGNPLGQSLEVIMKTGFSEMMAALPDSAFYQQKILVEGHGKATRHLWLMMNRIEDREGGHRYIGILEDRTEAIQQARSIEFLRGHDTQTGLLNKAAVMDEIQRYLITEVSEREIAALISLNIDDFRLINEAMGYDCGDAVIQELSVRLKNAVDPEDLLARSAGDEFLIFVKQIAHLEEIETLGQRLLQGVNQPVRWKGRELFITLSLGIAVYPFDSIDLESLMTYSAAALNNAKETGKNAVRFYSQEMVERAFERYELSNQLREALEKGEFFLVYQPVYALPARRIQGAEALIRWRHPTKGIISPDRFIPLAESTGIIGTLGDWVIEEACRQLKRWEAEGVQGLDISVNLSAIQLNDPHLVQRVERILQYTGVQGSRINMEITETVLMVRNSQAAENLARLKALGMGIHIDDFGTGFSSLAYLRDFHIDVLKIDRSFIRNIPDRDSGDIARLIIDLSRSLGIGVVAEGVETPEQLAFMEQNGCSTVQGFLFSKPVPPQEFAALPGLAGKNDDVKL